MSKSSARRTGRKTSEPRLFDEAQSTAIGILKEAIRLRARGERLTETLRDPSGRTEAWAFYVPCCFNEALDIRLTERVVDGRTEKAWTQGGAFAFGEGDVLYDTEDAYQKWSQALLHIEYAVQVKNATPVAWNAYEGEETDGENQVQAKNTIQRTPGVVMFTILRPNPDRTQLLERERQTVSQDEFVEFLIAGSETLTSKV